jgi:hypothetical protein
MIRVLLNLIFDNFYLYFIEEEKQFIENFLRQFYLLKNSSKHLVFLKHINQTTHSKMIKKILILTMLFFSFSCSTKVIDIKSPCVSSEDGPCGKKIQINDWWIKNSAKTSNQNS